ncbi:hypothetical protein PPYR_04673 [Photinus pyralis]|uniref:Multivesicular body subunit 12A n=1 Tax=Photinus pyralis TaxID=7054 RepID=A0A1Y1M389_PHOPY|nr:multivesicular body subunit 12B [Photinus pyralis]XP_031333280.1 multivesicular body subunit 12B [Photinus pyralis]KAB0802487.1 hypothetical protein PPYR_04673 [Photinus pyralis]
MSKKQNSNRILNTLSISLPDDRPITGIQVVESLDKCPDGFSVISRTYDQDQDADLWREGSFLKRKTERYLCLSKTKGLPGYIVEEILIVNDKIPPEGYCLLSRTVDTEQKAWRKKQLCYRLVPRKQAILAVTDIIICSRLKRAPEGFSLAGEINGVVICYKMGNVQDSEADQGHNGNKPPERPPKPAPYPPTSSVYPNIDSDHDYEILMPDYNRRSMPVRPAPLTPAQIGPPTHTISPTQHSLAGVPFVINPKFLNAANSDKAQLPLIKARTMQQLMKDYNYSFSVERQ